MVAENLTLAWFALWGHAALWIGLANRVHATGAPRWLVKICSGSCHFLLLAVPVVLIWQAWSAGRSMAHTAFWNDWNSLLWIYLLACWLLATVNFMLWLQRQWSAKQFAPLRSNHTSIVDVAAILKRSPLMGFPARLFSYVPGNQVAQLAVQQKQLELARLPEELEGLSIAHLTDLHFTGRVGIEYFHEVIRQTVSLRADLIVVTGDIVDELELLEWIPQTLGKLSAPLGVYFVLGNHDLFTCEAPRLRETLVQAGLTDLGGRWKQLDVHGTQLILAGNELPWFTPAADMEHCPLRSADRPQLRILLAHSPDQFDWARRWDFDLALAGHTHGGQIRLPLVGPLVCPSWYGVKYASGTFYSRPTLMHVSRGISAEFPLRLNCRPELAKLVLRKAGAGSRAKGVV